MKARVSLETCGPECAHRIASPRSLVALRRRGIKPEELVFKPLEGFLREIPDRRVAELHFGFREQERGQLLERAAAEFAAVLQHGISPQEFQLCGAPEGLRGLVREAQGAPPTAAPGARGGAPSTDADRKSLETLERRRLHEEAFRARQQQTRAEREARLVDAHRRAQARLQRRAEEREVRRIQEGARFQALQAAQASREHAREQQAEDLRASDTLRSEQQRVRHAAEQQEHARAAAARSRELAERRRRAAAEHRLREQARVQQGEARAQEMARQDCARRARLARQDAERRTALAARQRAAAERLEQGLEQQRRAEEARREGLAAQARAEDARLARQRAEDARRAREGRELAARQHEDAQDRLRRAQEREARQREDALERERAQLALLARREDARRTAGRLRAEEEHLRLDARRRAAERVAAEEAYGRRVAALRLDQRLGQAATLQQHRAAAALAAQQRNVQLEGLRTVDDPDMRAAIVARIASEAGAPPDPVLPGTLSGTLCEDALCGGTPRDSAHRSGARHEEPPSPSKMNSAAHTPLAPSEAQASRSGMGTGTGTGGLRGSQRAAGDNTPTPAKPRTPVAGAPAGGPRHIAPTEEAVAALRRRQNRQLLERINQEQEREIQRRAELARTTDEAEKLRVLARFAEERQRATHEMTGLQSDQAREMTVLLRGTYRK